MICCYQRENSEPTNLDYSRPPKLRTVLPGEIRDVRLGQPLWSNVVLGNGQSFVRPRCSR